MMQLSPLQDEPAEKCMRTGNPQADPRAVEVARKVLAETEAADHAVLFGSRARDDWGKNSDIDIMLLGQDQMDQDDLLRTQDRTFEIAAETFGNPVPIDVLFMTHGEFRLMSEQTVNHVASKARREGIIVPGNHEEYGYGHDEEDLEHRTEADLEHTERLRRTSDANMHYRNMHLFLDMEVEDKSTAYEAHQALEHAMKALISAHNVEYNEHHSTRALAADLRRLENDPDWRLASNLGRLDNFAAGNRYGPTVTPIQDYREMADNVTEDLDEIYERIMRINGEDSWKVLPENARYPVQPRWCPDPAV